MFKHLIKISCGTLLFTGLLLGGAPLLASGATTPTPKLEKLSVRTASLVTGDVKASPQSVSAVQARNNIRRAPRKAAAATDFVGNWMTASKSFYDTETDINLKFRIYEDNGTLKINNILGVDNALALRWNASNGTLELDPQFLFMNDNYGRSSINAIDMVNGIPVMNTTRPIVFSLNGDGTVSMSPWGCFVMEGAHKGGTFYAFYSNVLLKPNASLSYTPFPTKDVAEPETLTFDVVLYQEAENTFNIGNMLNTGRGYVVNLTGKGKGEITPQFVMEQGIFGEFQIYAANTKGAIDKNNPIKIAETETGFSISSWGAYCLKSTSIAVATGETTSVTTGWRPKYPEAGESTLTGEGTEASPYMVKTPADFKWIALKSAEGETFSGKYFKLANDVDFSSEKVVYTIGGTNETVFDAVFDGDSKTIKNINGNFNGSKYSGLFGLTGTKSQLKNINLTNVRVKTSGKNAGGLVAYSKGKIENCHATGRIEAKSYEVGGIAGYAEAEIKNCSFDGVIIGGKDCGGVAGYAGAPVTNCHANVQMQLTYDITDPYGSHDAGGVVGIIKGKNSSNIITISDCYASGVIYDPNATEQIGGVVGGAYNARVERCFNVARVMTPCGKGTSGSSPCAGGVLGYLSVGSVSNCYNAGAVSAPNTNFAGGIIGYVGGMSGVTHGLYSCYNSGMVQSVSDNSNCALYGGHFNKTGMEVKNSYYDIQTTGVEFASENPRTTAQLTSGEALEGLDPEIWLFTKGMYPRLKAFAETPEAILASAYMTLAGGDNIRKIHKPFAVSTANDVKWQFVNNGSYVDDCASMSVSGANVSLKNKYGYETIAARLGDDLVKIYTLRVIPKVFDGEGSAENPYLIKNVADLETLASAVNVYNQSHRGDCFKLMADLDFAGNTSFKGIGADGSGSKYFAGTFDGAGHSIKNFSLNTVKFTQEDGATKVDKDASTDYAGFFGVLAESSIIKNLIIDSSCKFTFYRASAPLAGYTTGKVENCVNNADVLSYGMYAAGIVGYTESRTNISACVNNGNIVSYDGYAGGITSHNFGTVDGCINTGAVSTEKDDAIVKTAKPRYTGGIVADNLGTVSNSINAGNVTGYDYVGAICGESGMLASDLSGGNLYGNLSYGHVTSLQDDAKYVGAVVGHLASTAKVEGNGYDYKLTGVGAADFNDQPSMKPFSTAELTSGKAPEYLKDSPFTFEKGKYPVIAALASDKSVAEASQTIVLTADAENLYNFATEAGVSIPQGMKAILKDGKAFKYEAGKLSLALGEAETAADTLVLSSGNYVKVLPLAAYASIFSGKGTEKDPFILATTDDMKKLATAVNEKGRRYRDNWFKLTADLDYKDIAFQPVGVSIANSFCGNFDGNGKTISNLTVGDTKSGNVNIGFFGIMGPGSIVKNLNFVKCAVKAYNYGGIVAGQTSGHIENCTNKESTVLCDRGYAGGFAGAFMPGASGSNLVNKAEVKTNSQKFIGGIGGVVYADLDKCGNEGMIIGASAGYAGGLAGQFRGTATACFNNGTIISAAAASYLGGFAGCIEKDVLIDGFINKGEITNGAGYIGGVYGTALASKGNYAVDGAYIRNCENHVDIAGTKSNIGGIAGAPTYGNHIEDCVNYGAISSSYASSSSTYAGGIAGVLTSDDNYYSYITRCRNYGAISCNGAKQKGLGGIAGGDKKGSYISECINSGSVTSGGLFVGGIVGDSNGSLISASVNLGKVTGGEYAVGGIAGYTGTISVINDCLNYGDVEATATVAATKYGVAGGIEGYGYGRVNNCANFGAVKGDKMVAGIAGTTFTGGDDQLLISNCYNAGKITVPEGVETVGNIFSQKIKHGENNYYLSDVNPELTTDKAVGAIGKTKAELLKAKFGDGLYIQPAASFPVPSKLETVAEARWATASYVLSEGDTEQSVSKDFAIAMAPGLSWENDNDKAGTVSDNVFAVKDAKNLDFILTAKCGDLAKSYKFHIVASSGISDIDADGDITSVEYFDLEGRRLAVPLTDGVTIVVKHFTDGTSKTEKISPVK